MKIQFMTSVAVIAPEPSVSRKLYIEALGLPWPGKVTATCTAKTMKDASPSGSGR